MKSSDGGNALYLVFDNVDAYIDCNSTGEKYLVFAFTCKNREALEIYPELWDELLSDVRPTKYEKDFIKIKFKSFG